MLTIIAAMDENNLIGNGNDLPWPHLAADMKHFRETTKGHPVIMGRKTFQSIGKPLPGRENIVLSTSLDPETPGITLMLSASATLDYLKGRAAFVIGGRQIYKLFMPHTHQMILTRIKDTFDGTVYFPSFASQGWSCERSFQLPTLDREPELVIETYTRGS